MRAALRTSGGDVGPAITSFALPRARARLQWNGILPPLAVAPANNNNAVPTARASAQQPRELQIHVEPVTRELWCAVTEEYATQRNPKYY
jgi:hypothetical protein